MKNKNNTHDALILPRNTAEGMKTVAQRAKPGRLPTPPLPVSSVVQTGSCPLCWAMWEQGEKAPDLPTGISAVKRVANESNKVRRGTRMHL